MRGEAGQGFKPSDVRSKGRSKILAQKLRVIMKSTCNSTWRGKARMGRDGPGAVRRGWAGRGMDFISLSFNFGGARQGQGWNGWASTGQDWRGEAGHG